MARLAVLCICTLFFALLSFAADNKMMQLGERTGMPVGWERIGSAPGNLLG
jgi:hypothetical protein